MLGLFCLKIFLAITLMAYSIFNPIFAMNPQDQIREARLRHFEPEGQAAEAEQPAEEEIDNAQQRLEDEDSILRDLLAAKWQTYLLQNPSVAADNEIERPRSQQLRYEIIRSSILHVLDKFDRNRRLHEDGFLGFVYILSKIIDNSYTQNLLLSDQTDAITHNVKLRVLHMYLSSLIKELRERDEQRHQRPIALATVDQQPEIPHDDAMPICTICLRNPQDPVVTCQEGIENPHICCRDCLLAWEQTRGGHLTCPMCRRDLSHLNLRLPLIKYQDLAPQLKRLFTELERTDNSSSKCNKLR